MVKVITYGTYDCLHYGHIRLLQRAKALGDYLIVGITSEDFDRSRGKINVQQSLEERIAAVRELGLADEIIIEEYEGQKIEDILRYDIDILTVGSDWKGKFDYLREYCQVVYLDRTDGISSTEIRSQQSLLHLGMVGNNRILHKMLRESRYVNGLEVTGYYTSQTEHDVVESPFYEHYGQLLDISDAVYIAALPEKHYDLIRTALEAGKHVLCESPIAVTRSQCRELMMLAKKKNRALVAATKTAYATAYRRLILLVKSGKIGQVVSVDATCTSLQDLTDKTSGELKNCWNSINAWGPAAMLPIFQLLGTDYTTKRIITKVDSRCEGFDLFTKIDFEYPDATASLKVGKGVKSEGELIVSGTKGYVYVPAPWWKPSYFEIRYENPVDNMRYFYQLEGEGLRYELVNFVHAVSNQHEVFPIQNEISEAICGVIEDYTLKKDTVFI